MIPYVLVALATLDTGPELHVVAAHIGHRNTAEVLVDRPGKEVVLVVSGSAFIVWDVRATPKTKLTKVFAVGNDRQQVGAANGVAVEELTHEGQKVGGSGASVRGAHAVEHPGFRPFVRELFAHTRRGITSFQGVYQYDPKKPFVVDGMQNDERLSSDFPKLPAEAQRPKVKIEASRVVYGQLRFREKWGFGEFTQKGPAAEGFVELPKGVCSVAYDAKNKQHYGLSRHGLSAVDLRLGTHAEINRPDGFSWPRAFTHDAKRDRVVISTARGLFEYGTKLGVWKQLTEDRFDTYAAVAWQAKTDTLFAYGEARAKTAGGKTTPTLYHLNADGTVAKQTPLGPPLFPGLVGILGFIDGTAELLDLGTELALLVHCENREGGTGAPGKPEAFLYVIDPATGRAKLAWKE